MISTRMAAVLATLIAVFSAAAPASACRVTAVEGYTGGPSVMRMVAKSGRTCAIPHYTITSRTRGLRAERTLVFKPNGNMARGRIGISGNRVAHRSRSNDRFAYGLIDRAGYSHDVEVHVVRR